LGGLPFLGALTSIVGAFLAMIFSGPAGILPFFFSWLFLLNPFTLVSAAMLLILCTHETQLEIDQQTFHLQFSCAGYTYRHLMGETRRLRGVVRRNAYCTLLYGVIPYSFGGWLNPGEQDWIIYQLADFVQQANHPDAMS
jgi:ABC-type multidrug transport system permease subunit